MAMISGFLSKLLTGRQASFSEENISIFELLFAMQPVKSIVGFQRDLERTYKDEGRDMMIGLGRNISDEIIGHFKKKFKMERSQLKNTWSNMFSLGGFGKLQLVKFGPHAAIVQTESSAIAKIYLNEFGRQKNPVCLIICGMLESYFKELTGKKAKCKETTCMANGNRYCTFEVSF